MIKKRARASISGLTEMSMKAFGKMINGWDTVVLQNPPQIKLRI